jgi:hypothetical protein|tara:strand:+ start:6200 stop:6775 length:576 start_codon:yes stop_codon:yes gene_type:complete
MNMLYYFVVKLDKAFNDEVDFNGDKIYMETKFDEFKHRVTQGPVVSTPFKYDTPVKPGDTLFFHHLVVMNGGQMLTGCDNHYMVAYDPNVPINSQAFAYRSYDSDTVHPLPGWSILSPDFPEELISEMFDLVSYEEPLPTRGVVAFDSDELAELGVYVGDTVGFKENRDYRFKIDGDEFYRTRCQDLLYAV